MTTTHDHPKAPFRGLGVISNSNMTPTPPRRPKAPFRGLGVIMTPAHPRHPKAPFKGLGVVLLLYVLPAFAQTQPAADAVHAFIQRIERQALRGTFTLDLDLTAAGQPVPQEQAGTFTLQGNRAAIDLEGISVRFDGTTLWTYTEAAGEVSVTEPYADDLATISPLVLLQKYYILSDIAYVAPPQPGTLAIEMRPKGSGQSDFRLIVLHLDEAARLPRYMRAEMADGTTLVLRTAGTAWAADVPDSTFTFDPAAHPGVYVNDLRPPTP